MTTTSSIDFLVIGAGVAGLRAAVTLARYGKVLVVTKESLSESNTFYAQGGIAVAAESGEEVALHLKDTLAAGDGLVRREAAEVLVSEGLERIAEMIAWGANFDRSNGQLLRTREGAHSVARILHAQGDATGAEISRALLAYVRTLENASFAEWTTATGLVVQDGHVVAVDLLDRRGAASCISARAVLIASGGAGQVYSETTNPLVATGDGIALASQAGAVLSDMEFYQFHPTALSLPGAPRFLLSEALRGEGAYLRNARGERFMERHHPLLELAPRDVVARAIAREGMDVAAGSSRAVYLDARHIAMDLHQRFPGISQFLATYGLDLGRDLIPVYPAAHSLMGGIQTDIGGRTSLCGLYAAGEAACTGVHGANRLASNSLLEGLVFGARAAQAICADNLPFVPVDVPTDWCVPTTAEEEMQVQESVTALRRAMWTCAGLLRDETSLWQGLMAQMEHQVNIAPLLRQRKVSRLLVEAMSLSVVSRAILCSALAREESRGAHFRSDYPQHDDKDFLKHSIYRAGEKVVFKE